MHQRERLRRRAIRRRSRRRQADSGWRVERIDYSERRHGPNITSASPHEVLAAIDELPADLPWPHVSSLVLPIFERVRPYPLGYPPHVEAIVPPGLKVGLALDIGPGLIHVTPDMLGGWGMSLADLTAVALANVHDRASQVQPSDIHHGPLGDVEVRLLQTGRGVGSTLVLAPTELVRLFGDGPCLFIAPMRDLIVGLPPGEDAMAAWLFGEIAAEDPNHLQPRAFAFDGRAVRVVPLDARPE
jgi:hypothetical protein